jgi:DNA topoisomerase IA
VIKCNIHEFFFDWNCNDCKEEYKDLKGTNKINQESHEEVRPIKTKKMNDYKEFTEEKAKKLYEEIFLQYLKKDKITEAEAIERSKRIIRKQCLMRNIEPWSWV